ncbi:MAG: flagellar basal body P-ring protein FlgI [Balneolaceae bacterium]|nr:flagellar basal body P-ring protein FlgI [Balneolaceae bacterium]
MKLNKPTSIFFCAIAIVAFSSGNANAQSRLSDLVEIQNTGSKELIGYGLVTGLDRTGDRSSSSRGAVFTIQSIANMLENFGITVDADRLRTRNVAAVMVTAKLSPYHAPGSEIDITVSSLGDASSLQGGVLLQTPLFDPSTEEMYAKAQGSLIVGGITAEVQGARVSRNQTLTATIPGGATVEKNEEYILNPDEPLGLVLRDPSFANARSIVEVINATFDEELAMMHHPGLIKVTWPDAFQDQGAMNVFTSIILEQEIEVETIARVVINERTGTIVAGGDVIIDDVMISHGSIQVRTQSTPLVSQPPAFSTGQTIVANAQEAAISEQPAQTIVLDPQTTVQQLAASLNALGLSPRDIIAIFQALNRAGVLRGKLIVM